MSLVSDVDRGLLLLAGALLLLPVAARGETQPVPPAAARSESPVPDLFDPRRPLERELELSVADGFTLAAVGDCIISRPLLPGLERDPDFAFVVDLLRRADATFGNLETSILSTRGFAGYPQAGDEDWALVSEPGVAADLKAMGFDLLGRANNHALDWGIEGMRETGKWLDKAGLIHAGVGEHRAEARAARYFETSRGRVALISLASSFRKYSDALPPLGEAPGRPGVSALRLQQVTLVPEGMMKDLAAIEGRLRSARQSCTFELDGSEEPQAGKGGAAQSEGATAGEVSVFGQKFRRSPRLDYTYEPDANDIAEILRTIRQGKQHSDFLIATIHAHETAIDCEKPGDFLPGLAHAAIDAGADAFIAHGSHKLGPIEIFKGKPIFYGLANFFWSDIQEPLPADVREPYGKLLERAFGDAEGPTDADLTAVLNAQGFNDEWVFRSVVAVSRFEGGKVSEVRLHPVDLGYGRRLTESGVPRRAASAVAREILKRLQEVSKEYGTDIRLEGEIGVIRPAS